MASSFSREKSDGQDHQHTNLNHSSEDDVFLQESPPEYEEADPALTKAIDHTVHQFPPTTVSPQGVPRLSKPIAIPQAVPGMGKPFARAYAQELSSHDLPIESFVQLIDNLNYLATSSPPLQALNLVGTIVGFVPNHWAKLAGFLVSGLSTAANIGVAKVRTKKFVQRVNTEVFGPRGLHFTIMKLDGLSQILLPGEGRESLMVQPITSSTDYETMGSSLQRRLDALDPLISPLQLTSLPPIDLAQMSKLDQLTTRATNHSREKGEKKGLKDRDKAVSKLEESNHKLTKETRKLDEETEKVNRKAEKEINKALRKGKREDVAKAEEDRDKDLRKIDEDRRKLMRETHEDVVKEDKEVKKSGKGLWIVIRSLPVE